MPASRRHVGNRGCAPAAPSQRRHRRQRLLRHLPRPRHRRPLLQPLRSPTNSGQSAMTWKGDFAVVPEPNHRSLFQTVSGGERRRKRRRRHGVGSTTSSSMSRRAKVPRPGATGAPSEECMALRPRKPPTRSRDRRLVRPVPVRNSRRRWPPRPPGRRPHSPDFGFRDSLGEYDAATRLLPFFVYLACPDR